MIPLGSYIFFDTMVIIYLWKKIGITMAFEPPRWFYEYNCTCGSEIEANAKFCVGCGTPITDEYIKSLKPIDKQIDDFLDTIQAKMPPQDSSKSKQNLIIINLINLIILGSVLFLVIAIIKWIF
jgi:uncharacterized membrane protein YvbJ